MAVIVPRPRRGWRPSAIGRQRQRAELRPVQHLDAVADGRDHALDLVVLAFDQRQPQ
jgi:hypothetical protein